MTVKDLIAVLQTYPQDLPIVFRRCSEHDLLEAADLCVEDLQLPRPDGWVHDQWSRGPNNQDPPVPTIKYLVFPGN